MTGDAHLAASLARHRAAAAAHPAPSAEERIAWLRGLGHLLETHRDDIVEAISADFGHRAPQETLLAEYTIVADGLRHARRHLASWMKPRARRVDRLVFPGARNRVEPRPLGVVGVIVPWNFPLLLAFSPLTAIFAAGNRAMVKMSEKSPRLTALLCEAAPRFVPEDTLSVFADDGTRGPSFAALPFDHLLFTGSTTTGRAVMAGAARTLTPVTLELGGKNPAIVGPDADIDAVAGRVMWAKLLNAGQACTSIDHVFVPTVRVDAFVAACRQAVATQHPDIAGPDYTSIVDDASVARLHGLLDDARARGAIIIDLAPQSPAATAARKFAPRLVLGATGDMAVMREEIFGPILPVLAYDTAPEVADRINARDTPLALYPFTRDRALQRFYIERVRSGGVALNEAHLQIAQTDLPFGGVGASGIGQYHAREGFATFSQMRPVFEQGRVSLIERFLRPPYGVGADRLLRLLRAVKSLR